MAEGKYRNLKNQDYWIERSTEQADKQWKQIKTVEKELAKQYRIAMDDISQMISNMYTQYAVDNKLSYAVAMKELNATEIGDYKAKLDRMLPMIRETKNPFLIAEFEKLQKLVKLNRLQALESQMDARLLQMGHTQQVTMEEWLAGTYETTYYQTLYNVQVGTGMGVAFAKLNEKAIIEAIAHPWSGDMFSSRIWDNKTKLVKELRQTVIQGLIKGSSVQSMSRDLKGTMNSSYTNALRLIRTETAYVYGESTAKGYAESKVIDQYVYIATLDGKTSSICRKVDNKVYKLEDRQVGVNASPLHPNCRSTEAPYFGEMDGERIAVGADGERYYVPSSMDYQEWHNKYVK